MISAEQQQRLLAAGEHGLTPYSFLEDIKGIENFDWPINGQKGEGENDFTDNDDISDDDEKLFHVKYYRKITNFRVCDVFGIRSKAFFIDEIDPSRYFLLIGDLIPCPQSKGDGSSTRAIALKVPITEMFYNFGLENDGSVETKKQLFEDARLEAGFWVRDFECTLYQLVPPALESYSEIFEVCLNAAKSQFKPADAHFGRKIHLLENTTIHNSNEEHVNPLESKISDNHFAFAKLSFLHGSSSSKLRSIKVRIPFILWELSFGDCINNELNTGFLISNLNNHIWFKVNSTAESYVYREELSNCLDSTKAILSGCGKPHKFYDTEYRRITHFEITSYDGKVMEEALPRPKPTSTPESLIFALSGMILKSKEEIFRVRTFINDYVIDIGYRPKDEISIFTFSLDKSLYRLHWSSKCRFPKFDAVITDYHWPSEDQQVWRRIKDYKLTDVEGNDSTLLTQASLSILKAYLIPPESFDYLEDLKVQVYVEGYSIDFGQSIEDDNRGLWLRDNHENWYKVTPNALPEYEPLAKEGLVKTRKFLRLYETVVNSENPAFVEFDEKHQQYVCDYTIQDIYKLSNRKFDLAFVSDNKKFVLDNIDNVIHKGKSRKFYNSLNVLTATIVSEAQNPTAPKPKTGKEEYEKAPKLIPETSAKPSVLEASDRSDLSLIPIKRRVIEEDTAASKPTPAPPKTIVPCSFCKGIKKLNHCPYANHKDGKGIEPDALARPIKRKAIDADIVDEDTVKRQKPIESTQINRLAPTPGLSARPPSTVRLFGPPRGEPVKKANSPFCNYCKGLKRSLKCTNARHRDGFPIDLPSANDQVRDSRLCPVCQSTRKACNDEKHVDGHYYPYNPARPASTSVSVARSNPSSSAAVTKPDEERTFNEEKVKEGEKKEKEKYFSHHKPRVESTDAMAEKLMPLVLPLGGAKKSPLERLRESSMHAPGVFRELTETPKFDPLDKSAKPDKSILKMVSKDWSMYELNSGFPKTTRLKFVDESSNKPLEQLIVYSHYIPSPEDVEMS